MDEQIKRALISVVTFVLCSLVSVLLMDHASDSLLMSAEDRQGVEHARHVLAQLEQRWGRAVPADLDAHELQIAASMTAAPDAASFASVGGLATVKRELQLHVIVPLRRHRVFYASPALRPPPGVLLEGPPGTGKTMLARALATESNVPFVPLLLSTVENKYVGESQKLLRAVFSLATKLSPAIVFVDEIDGMMRQRSPLDSAHDYGLKTTFLQLLDQVRELPIITVAATNCAALLDPALRRRLPRAYRIDLPDAPGRRQILDGLTRDERRNAPAWLTEATGGFSGSALSELYHRASAARNEALAADSAFLDGIESADELHISLPAITDAQWEQALAAVPRFHNVVVQFLQLWRDAANPRIRHVQQPTALSCRRVVSGCARRGCINAVWVI